MELIYRLYCTVILVMQKLQTDLLRNLLFSFSLRCNFNRREKEKQREDAEDYVSFCNSLIFLFIT